MAVEIRNRLAAATGLRLRATLLFESPTLRAIAKALTAALANVLPRTSAPNTSPLRSRSNAQGGEANARAREALRDALTSRFQVRLRQLATQLASLGPDSKLVDELSESLANDVSLDLEAYVDGASVTASTNSESSPDLAIASERAGSELQAELNRPSMHPSPSNQTVFDWHNDRPILLTGATGFLGAYLLRDLLDSTDREILVVARANNEQDALARVQANLRQYGHSTSALSSRVRLILADLASQDSGLSDALIRELANQVGLIVHAAAAVHHAAPYDLLKASNVTPLIRLLRVAARGPVKPLAFISTTGIFVGARTDHPRDDDDAPPSPFDDADVGYLRTKLVCESLIDTARARGMPIRIFRPSLVFGTTTSPIGAQYAHVGVLLLRAIARSGSYPTTPISLDAVPVDAAAKTIVALSTVDNLGADTFNVSAQVRLSTHDMAAALKQTGYLLSALEPETWLREAERAEPLLSLYAPWLFARSPALDIDSTAQALTSLGLATVTTLERGVLLTQIEDCIQKDEIPRPRDSASKQTVTNGAE
jgi:thioester reductase-like protein